MAQTDPLPRPIERADLLESVLFQQALRHPLPWHINSDWTEEVITSDGYCIAKCQTVEEAVSIIAVAIVAAKKASGEQEADSATP